ncbi:MAG: hypothetical protein AB7O26_17165 [Planctomycetaceae bacterium]
MKPLSAAIVIFAGALCVGASTFGRSNSVAFAAMFGAVLAAIGVIVWLVVLNESPDEKLDSREASEERVGESD